MSLFTGAVPSPTYRPIPSLPASFQAFISRVEHTLSLEHPEWLPVFRKCFIYSYEATTERLKDGTTFVYTGDIPAMWLRDSSAQLRIYAPFARNDPEVARLVRGLIQRQAGYICQDPYANAFNIEANGKGHQTDLTDMAPWIWERKYELDSLCYPIQLLKDYWEATQDATIFDESIHKMLTLIVDTMVTEQNHDSQSLYHFERPLEEQYLPTDTLPFDGRGARTNYTGMSWSGFRPSDDACTYGYLVPANMFAQVVLGYILDFDRHFYQDRALFDKAARLRNEIESGIQTYGIVEHPVYGKIYAYETDGFGNYVLMDDANVPNLLSIPYFGYRPASDPIYQNTRAFILSDANPNFHSGRYARGLGSAHTPGGLIWHLGLIMQGLTSASQEEMRQVIDLLLATTAGTGYMHEGFHPDHPDLYTRAWFGWANSLFSTLLCKYTGIELGSAG